MCRSNLQLNQIGEKVREKENGVYVGFMDLKGNPMPGAENV